LIDLGQKDTVLRPIIITKKLINLTNHTPN
jgi:hypothetical protein